MNPRVRPLAILLSVAALLSTWSCSTGFDRAEMQDVIRQTVTLPASHTDPTVTTRPPALPRPFRLGVFFSHRDFPTRQAITPADWRSQDHDALLRVLTPLQGQHLLQDILVIAHSSVETPSVADIRKAAARYGADVLLVVTGAGSVDRHHTWSALLYPTIIGAYWASGTVSDALFLIDGSLWDVRSGVPYGSHRAEGLASQSGPAASLDDRNVLAEAKASALRILGTQLTEWVRRTTADAAGVR